MKSISHVIRFIIIIAFLFSTPYILYTQADSRENAMRILWEAFLKEIQGDSYHSQKLVEKALTVDPNFAYANIVRAEIAMENEDWLTAKQYFEKGISLLDQPNQPLSPSEGVAITKSEVEGNALCSLGYVYIMMAQNAHESENYDLEYQYLMGAKENLLEGLNHDPVPPMRTMAKELLRKFNI